MQQTIEQGVVFQRRVALGVHFLDTFLHLADQHEILLICNELVGAIIGGVVHFQAKRANSRMMNELNSN
jgi:hypothetical protein